MFAADRSRVAKYLPTAEHHPNRPGCGRTWWAHLEFTRIHIELTILPKKFEELMNVRGVGETSFLKLKPLVTLTPPRSERAAAQTP